MEVIAYDVANRMDNAMFTKVGISNIKEGEYFYCIKEGFCLPCDNVNYAKDELSDFEW